MSESLTQENRAVLERVVGPGWESAYSRTDLQALMEAVREDERNTRAPAPASAPAWEDHEDEIAEAVSDSMDVDWTSQDGARAVVRYLKSLGSAATHGGGDE